MSTKKYRENNKEKIKQYREKNKDYQKRYQMKWRKSNKEKIRMWRKTNREKLNKRQRENYNCKIRAKTNNMLVKLGIKKSAIKCSCGTLGVGIHHFTIPYRIDKFVLLCKECHLEQDEIMRNEVTS